MTTTPSARARELADQCAVALLQIPGVDVAPFRQAMLSAFVRFEAEIRAEATRAANERIAELEGTLRDDGDVVAMKYVAELYQIAGMLAQQPDGPVRWKQYRLVAIADYLGSNVLQPQPDKDAPNG